MFFTYFSLTLSNAKQICLSPSDKKACPSDHETYYDNINISDLSLSKYNDEQLKIIVLGNIKYTLTLLFPNPVIEFVGIGKTQSSINLLPSVTHELEATFSELTIYFKKNENEVIHFHDVYINDCSVFTESKVNFTCSIFEVSPFASFIDISSDFACFRCEVFLADFTNLSEFKSASINLDCPTIKLNNISNVYFGFSTSKLLISDQKFKNTVTIICYQKCTIDFDIVEPNVCTYFINYYQYFVPFFNSLIIHAKAGTIEFEQCEWFSDTNFISIYAESANLKILTSIPATIFVSDKTKIFSQQENIKIHKIVVNASLEFDSYNASKTEIEVEYFDVDTPGIIDINDNTNLIIKNLGIKSDQFFLSCEDNCYYNIQHITFQENFNEAFHFEIDRLSVKDFLYIDLPNTTNGKFSTIHVKEILGNGYISVSYPENLNYNDSSKVFWIRYESASKKIDFILNAPTSHFNNGSIYLKQISKINEFYSEIIFIAVLANNQIGNCFCVGDGCNETDYKLSTERDNNTNWIDHFINVNNTLNLKVYDNNSFKERNFLNLFQLSSFPEIALNVNGNKNGNCTHNQFVLNGMIFHQFGTIELNCVNAKMKFYPSHINLEKATLRNSYIDEQIEHDITRIRNIDIDYQTLNRIKDRSKKNEKYYFKFNDNNEREITLSWNNEDRSIILYEDFLCFEDINISCKMFNICSTGIGNITIRCQTKKKPKYSLRFLTGFNLAKFLGDFPTDLVIPVNIIHSTFYNTSLLYSNSYYCPCAIIMNKFTQLIIYVQKANYAIPSIKFVDDASINIALNDTLINSSVIAIKHIQMINTTSIQANSTSFELKFDKVSVNNKEIIGSALGNCSLLKVDQEYGAFMNFTSLNTAPSVIEIPFSISRLPLLSFDNGTYENLSLKFVTLPEEISERECLLIKNRPMFYKDPMKLACGQNIKCETWHKTIETKNKFWKYMHFNCKRFEDKNEKCLVIQLDSDYEQRYSIFYKCFYGLIAAILLLSSIILYIRRFTRERHKKQYNRYWSRSDSLSGFSQQI